MANGRKLSIEIRRDSATPSVSMDGVAEGIATLQEIYSNIKLVDRGELMYLAEHDCDVLDFESIAKLHSDQDMLMVLSNRPFHDTREGHYVFGKTYNYFNKRIGSLAVIDARNSGRFMTQVVAHEGFHMFGAKESGDYYDGDSHCTQTGCLMIHEVSNSDHVCDECIRQLELNAYELAHPA